MEQHDQAWFIAQVRQHQSRLRSSIRALGVRAEAVDDIAQDTLLLAWKKIAEFDHDGNFGAWVAQIARRLIANERRKDARRSRLLAGEITDVLLQLAAEKDKATAGLVSAWIYLDRCDFSLNAIFNSDSWRPGALHVQMSRTGNCVIGHWAKKPQRRQLGPHVPMGRWTHVAAVADLDGLGTKTYINGELAEKVKLASFPGALKPGSCRIGDWFPDKDPSSNPRRGFRGRIDELAVWGRAVSDEEIREMVAAGRSTRAAAD